MGDPQSPWVVSMLKAMVVGVSLGFCDQVDGQQVALLPRG
jgi:hypothetical protein